MKIYRDNNNNLVILREENEKRLYLESTFYRHLADQINKLLSIDTIPKVFVEARAYGRQRAVLPDRPQTSLLFLPK